MIAPRGLHQLQPLWVFLLITDDETLDLDGQQWLARKHTGARERARKMHTGCRAAAPDKASRTRAILSKCFTQPQSELPLAHKPAHDVLQYRKAFLQ